MKKLLPLLLTLSICLWAADFWASKPFTDWSEKDVQKMENSSPWSKQISVQVGGGSSGGGSGKGRSKGGGGSGGGEIESMGSATGGMGVGGGSRGGQEGSSGGGGSSLNLTVSWRTALPIRQAVAKEKFGKEAGTSPEAKKLIEEDQKYYAILLTGLPGRAIGNGEKLKAMLLKTSSLSVKGKDPIAPSDVQAGTSEQKTLVLFLFPKTTAFDLDDKDVEFSTQLGPLNVKQKFHLKDMVFNGKLEL
jgi:hypothetical protein